MMSYELRSAQWRRVEGFLSRRPGWVEVTAKDNRIVFGLDDLVTVRLRCAKCQGDVSQSLDATDTMPDQCPLCSTFWGNWGNWGNGEGQAVGLLRAIRRARREQDAPVTLRLEIDGED